MKKMKHLGIDIVWDREEGKLHINTSNEIDVIDIAAEGLAEAYITMFEGPQNALTISGIISQEILRISDPEAYKKLMENIETAKKEIT